MTTGWVYAVHDEDGAVVYVGQTNDLPARRYRAHLGDARRGSTAPFHAWLRDRMYAGDVPRVSTLERPPLVDLDARERFWICHYAALRSDGLLNVSGRHDRAFRIPDTEGVRETRAKLLAVVDKLIDGPFYDFEVLHEAGVDQEDWGYYGEQLVDECLLAAGYLKRGDKYVRAGTTADRLSDPSIDLATRLGEWISLHPHYACIRPRAATDALFASVDEIKEQLPKLGYTRRRGGIWCKAGTETHLAPAPNDLGLSTGGAS